MPVPEGDLDVDDAISVTHVDLNRTGYPDLIGRLLRTVPKRETPSRAVRWQRG